MPVNFKRQEYLDALPQWEQGEDAVKGSPAIKKKTVRYLPQPNKADTSKENQDRYAAYVERASFVNFTSQTEDGFLGMVEKKPHVINLSGELEKVGENIDGCGLTLSQSIVSSIRGLLRTGRDGLLVDIAVNVSGETNKRATAGLLPTIKRYKSQSIINWRETVIDGQKVLELVVLEEMIDKVLDDGFDMMPELQYRCLKLIGGNYAQTIFNKDLQPTEQHFPTDSTGALLTRIPFYFIGSEDNDVKIDKATLYDISSVNIAHYRNSADFEESSFMVGQPTLTMSGLTDTWVKDVLGGSVSIGSRGGLMLPAGGTADLLQANENQMPSKGMEMKEIQMVKLGALVIEDSGGNETAEAAKIRFAGQNSKLGRLVKNVEQAYKVALQWAAMFTTGTDPEIELVLNTDFFDASINPQMIIAEIQQLDRGIMAKSDLRNNARKRNQIAADRTDEDIDLENGEASPLE